MERKQGAISIHQEQNTEALLKKHGLSNCNPLKIPVTVIENIVKANDKDEMADATSYRKLT